MFVKSGQTYHEWLNALFCFVFSEGRSHFFAELGCFHFHEIYGLFSRLTSCNSVTGLSNGILELFFFIAEDLKLDCLLGTLFASGGCNHVADSIAERMHRERVMLLILVLPCERVLAFGLLPQHLEHRAIIHYVKAIVACLDRHTFPVDVHLVHEVFTLPTSRQKHRTGSACCRLRCDVMSYLLLHLSFELAINHDFFLGAHFWVE